MYTLASVAQHRFGDVYVLDVQRTAAGAAAVTSDGRLWALDAARLGATGGWQTGHGSGPALAVFDAGAGVVCTAGADGAVGVWDLRLGGDAARVARFAACDAPVASLACSAAARSVAVGTELTNHTASLLVWDVRRAAAARARYDEAHSDDITALALDAPRLLSASADGLVSVHDMRAACDDDEPTLHTRNLGASVQRAGLLGPAAAFALSHDERFAVYDLDDDGETHDCGDLRAALGCQYVAGVAPKTDGSGAILGAGAHDRHALELVLLARTGRAAWALDADARVSLPGAHGADIVRAFCCLDEHQRVLTAGEDGSVKAWGPPGGA